MQKTNQKSWLALGIVGAGLVIILGAALWGLSAQPPKEIPQVTLPNDPSQAPRASLDEAYQAYQQEDAVFVDVRSIDSYSIAHISGAVSIPENEVADRLNELSKGKWIIPYCT